MPKYHGYWSSIDFYTFKSECEKLISGRIRAKLLPDYLKCNYLEGQASEIVKEIHQMDEIWERLKNAFGNVDVLLNNMLSEVIKYGPPWKIKHEEIIIQVMIKLINGMMELGTSAKKHKIEEILYHPSNPLKIYELRVRYRKYNGNCSQQFCFPNIAHIHSLQNLSLNANMAFLAHKNQYFLSYKTFKRPK